MPSGVWVVKVNVCEPDATKLPVWTTGAMRLADHWPEAAALGDSAGPLHELTEAWKTRP